jgi:hypothetical protein
MSTNELGEHQSFSMFDVLHASLFPNGDVAKSMRFESNSLFRLKNQADSTDEQGRLQRDESYSHLADFSEEQSSQGEGWLCELKTVQLRFKNKECVLCLF